MATHSNDVVDDAFVYRFLKAWDEHNVDAILEMMTDDVVYESSFGTQEYGRRFVGKSQARQGIERVFSSFPQTRFTDAQAGVVGNRGFAEWTMSHIDADGKRVGVRGCDLFVFRDGKISKKDSYRKNRVGVEE